ncbi:MAG: LysR family transcriptional regulator [Peptococcaceae bacterium]|nr:LysR family transcriptional regulator [Peptococcaceae bacterium]
MRLEQLIYLTEVIDCGNMHQASKNLFTSVQNISKSIKELENELGVILLNRGRFGTVPTGDGKIVYEKAIQIRHNIEDIQQLYVAKSPELSSTGYNNVKVLSVPSMTLRLRHIAELINQENKQFALSLFEYEGNALNRLLEQHSPQLNSYDLIFMASGQRSLEKYKPLLDEYTIYILKFDKLSLSVSKNSKYAQEKHISLKTLKQIPLASFQASIDEPSIFFSILNEYDYNNFLEPVYISNLHMFSNDYIEQNPQIAVLSVMPDHIINTIAENRINIPIKEQINVVHLMAYRNDVPQSSETAVFVKKILQYFKNTSYKFTI